MKLNRLTAVNFCQHEHIDEEFSTGLVGIIGANGSGKSNLLGAIIFALTGDNPNAGTKASNIRINAAASAASYVELQFSHAGVTAVVRRNLRPATPTATLQIGDNQIVGDKAVTAKIEEILQVPMSVLTDIAIVQQNGLFTALSASNRQRAEYFQRLFDTRVAKTIYDAIGNYVKGIEIPTCGASIDELERQLKKIRDDYVVLTDTLAKSSSFDEIQQRRTNAVRVVTLADHVSNLQSLKAQYTQQQTALTAQLQQLEASVEAASLTLNTLHSQLETAAVNEREASGVLASLQHIQENLRIREQLNSSITTQRNELAGLRMPEEPIGYVTQDVVRGRLGMLTDSQRRLQGFLDSFKDGVTQCPTCGTSTTALAGKLEESVIQLAAVNTDIENAAQFLQSVIAYDDAVVTYRQNLAYHTKQLDDATKSLAALGPLPTTNTNVDEQSLRQQIATAETLRNNYASAQSALDNLRQQETETRASFTSLQQYMAQVESQLQGTSIPDASQVSLSRDTISACDSHIAIRRNNETQLASLDTEIAATVNSISEAQSIQARAAVVRRWKDHCEELRSVFHNDGAPRFVAHQRLKMLEASINNTLQLFGAEFVVAAEEGLSFSAVFPNKMQPANRLSGGQKVVLSLALVLSLNLLFAADLGLIMLDEPTAYLDAHHIQGFKITLERLRQVAESRDLQCFMITHEKDLAPLFQSVVRIE